MALSDGSRSGNQAYQDMIPASEHKRRRAAGEPPEHAYINQNPDDAPVMRVKLSKVEHLSDLVTLYEFSNPDGSPLPPSTAGAHIDVVVAPEFFRQYSMSHNPADPSKYQIAVLREDTGRGGSKLMHRIFEEGRMVFISKPINHFPLIEEASITYLMGGGIGITPMVAMAHRLHEIGADFELHYSASKPTRPPSIKSCAPNPGPITSPYTTPTKAPAPISHRSCNTSQMPMSTPAARTPI